MNTLEQRITAIEARNKRVEADKEWETSSLRRVLIAGFTYAVVVIVFFIAKTERPFFNALIPTLGFLLSTLTVDVAKNGGFLASNLDATTLASSPPQFQSR